MKKLLMGAMATAMAVTAFGGTIEDNLVANGQLVKTPINATIKVGTMTPTTSIAVTGDLNFGSIIAKTGTNVNQDSPVKTLEVFKVTKLGNVEQSREKLGVGEYAYKLSPASKDWDTDGQWAVTSGESQHHKIFKENGQGEEIAIGSGGFVYSGRTKAEETGLNVWFSGDIDSANNGKTYEVSANVFVTFPENVNN